MNTEVTHILVRLDTEDTHNLARMDREDQGPWEAEYSYGGEADLHRHYDRCNKNAGHKNFIPVDKFSIEDLPEGYRDKDLVDYIRAVSDLTVRVSVKYVSDKRPATVSGSGKFYPGYSVRGQSRMTVGTGWVISVSRNPGSAGQTCPCKDCQNSSTPKENYAMISIITSAHVVYDETEGAHTKCHLFFDRGSSPDICSNVVTLNGMSNIKIQLTNDWCDMKHFTHDLGLAHRLSAILKQASKLRSNIFRNTLTIRRITQRHDIQDKQPLLFIVSHPHGCFKHVSLGRWQRMEVDKEENIICHLYTTPTCPGSSGALVCMPQAFTSPHVDVAFFTFRAAHSGTAEHTTTEHAINYCQADPDLPMLQMLSLETPQTNTGTLEGHFCCVKDEDEDQDLAVCKKNPDHGNLVAVEKFSLDNLPPASRRDYIMDFIKLMSDLTVHVSVKYINEDRPEIVPGTDIPSPWFNNIGSQLIKVGIGWVSYIEVYPNVTCSCTECENSKTPATSFAHLSVNTYTHVVYDDLECQQNTRHLLLDVSDSPRVFTDNVVLVDVSDVYHDNSKPTRRLKYSTHNLQLASRLKNTTQKHSHYIISLTRNKEARYRSDVQQNGGENNKYEPPLDIVVTRPGGYTKEVRISCCGHPDDGTARGKLYPCTFINVLGFSEARVIVLGMESAHPGQE